MVRFDNPTVTSTSGLVREGVDPEAHALLLEPPEIQTGARGASVEHRMVRRPVQDREVHVQVVERLVLADVDHDREQVAAQDRALARAVRADDLDLDLGLAGALLGTKLGSVTPRSMPSHDVDGRAMPTACSLP